MILLFTCLIVLQFVIIVAHDLIDIPGWVHGSQVQAQIGKRKVWLATLANAVFPGIAAGFAVYFWNRPTGLCLKLLGHLLRGCAHVGDCDVVCPVL